MKERSANWIISAWQAIEARLLITINYLESLMLLQLSISCSTRTYALIYCDCDYNNDATYENGVIHMFSKQEE